MKVIKLIEFLLINWKTKMEKIQLHLKFKVKILEVLTIFIIYYLLKKIKAFPHIF